MSGHADTIRRVTSWCGHDRECAVDPPCDVHMLVAELVRQADRIAWLEGEVAGWRIKNQQLRDALRWIEPQQQNALTMIERNGFVFESIGNEPGNWQHLAFSIYSLLCEIDSVVRQVLDGTPSEDA